MPDRKVDGDGSRGAKLVRMIISMTTTLLLRVIAIVIVPLLAPLLAVIRVIVVALVRDSIAGMVVMLQQVVQTHVQVRSDLEAEQPNERREQGERATQRGSLLVVAVAWAGHHRTEGVSIADRAALRPWGVGTGAPARRIGPAAGHQPRLLRVGPNDAAPRIPPGAREPALTPTS